MHHPRVTRHSSRRHGSRAGPRSRRRRAACTSASCEERVGDADIDIEPERIIGPAAQPLGLDLALRREQRPPDARPGLGQQPAGHHVEQQLLRIGSGEAEGGTGRTEDCGHSDRHPLNRREQRGPHMAQYDDDLQERHRGQPGWRAPGRYRRARRPHRRASAISARDTAERIVDCTGLHILPGVIDTQVHFREPGLTHKEDLESGSLSAVMGGVTGVFEMPNTNPLTTTRETFEAKIAAGTSRMHCDFAFFIGGTHENVGAAARARAAARLRRRQGVHGLVDRLAARRRRRRRRGHPPRHLAPRLVPLRGRVPARGAQAPARPGRPVVASGLARSSKRR